MDAQLPDAASPYLRNSRQIERQLSACPDSAQKRQKVVSYYSRSNSINRAVRPVFSAAIRVAQVDSIRCQSRWLDALDELPLLGANCR
jgi:hypothetical protein